MKYADCPTAEVSIDIAGTPDAVWALVSDIGLSSRFSTEVSGADWLPGYSGPALDAQFAGHSAHDAIGECTTTCIVTGIDEKRLFEWSVIGRDNDVSSIWRYTIDDAADDTTVPTYWFQMGPGRSGLNYAIDRMPDKEEGIVARRLDEHRQNMERVLAGIEQVVESNGAPA